MESINCICGEKASIDNLNNICSICCDSCGLELSHVNEFLASRTWEALIQGMGKKEKITYRINVMRAKAEKHKEAYERIMSGVKELTKEL